MICKIYEYQKKYMKFMNLRKDLWNLLEFLFQRSEYHIVLEDRRAEID